MALVEVLKFLELKYKNITKPLATISTLEFCADLLENATANCTEDNGFKLNFLTEQIRLCTVENLKSRPTLFPGISCNGMYVEFFIFFTL